jgi:Fur family peroxide stress response transcriptional regulator
MITDYKKLGIKLTPQRLAVLDYLEGNKNHPSAEDVYKFVKERFPTLSFATVYNILKTLEEKGLVQGLEIDPERRRFDPDLKLHHHFFCSSCKKVKDLMVELNLPLKGREAKGFKVSRVQVSFYGVCPECQSKERKGRR